VSFGSEEDYKAIQSSFSNLGVLNPIDGHEVRASYDSRNNPKKLRTSFYLIAVPSYFQDISDKMYMMHQLTVSHNSDTQNAQENLLSFNYELSPISVHFYQVKEDPLEFAIHICAIIGGIFTIASIIDAIIYRSVSVLFKERIGKLS
jgi:hypothetical protein